MNINLFEFKMIDTNKSTQYKNPYYSDIITYLLSRQ